MEVNIYTYPDIETLKRRNERKGKFVRLSWKGVDTYLFATKDQCTFHNEILGRFLSEHNLPAQAANSEQRLKELTQLKLRGGGRFAIDWQNGTLELSDNSTVYGRFDASGIEAALAAANHPISTLKVAIQ